MTLIRFSDTDQTPNVFRIGDRHCHRSTLKEAQNPMNYLILFQQKKNSLR